MSVWKDIRQKSLGKEKRLENIFYYIFDIKDIPQNVVSITEAKESPVSGPINVIKIKRH